MLLGRFTQPRKEVVDLGVLNNDFGKMKFVMKDRIASMLRDLILKGEIAPGTKLKAGDIAEKIGVSRGPVREAIWQLVQEGLVVHDPHHTPMVVELSPLDAWEIYTLRAALEQMAVELMASTVTDDDLDYLAGLIGDMRALRPGDNMSQALALDLAFHGHICSLSGHGRLIDAFRAMDPAIGAVFVGIAVLFGRGPETMAERHEPILAVLRQRNPTEAMAAVREHYWTRAGEFLRAGTR